MEGCKKEYFCKNCKQEVAKQNYELHTLHCERKLKLCELCEKPVNIDDFPLHLDEDHIIVPCPQCKNGFEKWTLSDHMHSCSKRLKVCQYCDSEFPFDELDDHLHFCGSRTEKCVHCQTYVMIKDQKAHSQIHLRPKEKPLPKHVDEEVLQNHRNECISQSIRAVPKKSDENCSKLFGVCHICKQQVRWIDMNLHVPTCATDAGKCSVCGEKVSSDQIKQHIMEQCPKVNNRGNRGRDANSENNGQTRGRSNFSNQEEEKVASISTIGATAPDFSISEVSSKRFLTCPICKEGHILESLFENHMKACGDQSTICSGCHRLVLRRNLENHLLKECPHLSKASNFEMDNKQSREGNPYNEALAFGLESELDVKKCPYCEQKCSTDRLLDHVKRCSRSTPDYSDEKECLYCRKKYSLNQISDHIKNCTYNTHECPLCGEVMQRSEKEKHEGFFCVALLNIENESRNSSFYGDAQRNSPSMEKEGTGGKKKKAFDSCPKCHNVMSADRIDAHLLTCHRNTKTCKLCKATFNAQQIDNHTKQCPVLVQGQHRSKNNKSNNRGAVSKHSNITPKIKECPHCKTNYNYEVFDNHEESCIHKPVKCDYCKKKIPLNEFEKHLENHERQDHKAKEKHKEKPGYIKRFMNIFTPNLGSDLDYSAGENAYYQRNSDSNRSITENDALFAADAYDEMEQNMYKERLRSSQAYNQNSHHRLMNQIPPEEEECIPCEFCGKKFSISKSEEMLIHSFDCGGEEIPANIKMAPAPENVSKAVPSKNSSFFGGVSQPPRQRQQPGLSSDAKAGEFLHLDKCDKTDEFLDACAPIKDIQSVWNCSLNEGKDESLSSEEESVKPMSKETKTKSLRKKVETSSSSDDDTEKHMFKSIKTKSGRKNEVHMNLSDDDAEKLGYKETKVKHLKKSEVHKTFSADHEETKVTTIPKFSKTCSVRKEKKISSQLSCDNETKNIVPKLDKKVKLSSPSSSDDDFSAFNKFVSPKNDLKTSSEKSSSKNVYKEKLLISKTSEGSDMVLTPNLFFGINSVSPEKREFFDRLSTDSNMELTANPCNKDFPESDRPVQISEARKYPYEQYLNQVFQMEGSKLENAPYSNQYKDTSSANLSDAAESDKFMKSTTSNLTDNTEFDIITLNSSTNEPPLDEILLQNRCSDSRSNVQISDVSSTEILLLNRNLNIDQHTQPDLLSSVNPNHLKSEPTFKIRADSFALYKDLKTKETAASHSTGDNVNLADCKYSKLKYDPNRKTVEIEIKEADLFNLNKGRKNRNNPDTQTNIASRPERELENPSAESAFASKLSACKADEKYDLTSQMAKLNISKNEYSESADVEISPDIALKDEYNTDYVKNAFSASQDIVKSLQSQEMSFEIIETTDCSEREMPDSHPNNSDFMHKVEAVKFGGNSNIKLDNENFHETSLNNKQTDLKKAKRVVEIDLTKSLLGLKNELTGELKKKDNTNAAANRSLTEKRDVNHNGDLQSEMLKVEYRSNTIQNAAFKIEPENDALFAADVYPEMEQSMYKERLRSSQAYSTTNDASASTLRSAEDIIKGMKLCLETAKKVLNDGTTLHRNLKNINAEYEISCEKVLEEKRKLGRDSE